MVKCATEFAHFLHKIGRFRKFNGVRKIEFNFNNLDYLREIWHTCSAWSWLQTSASDF